MEIWKSKLKLEINNIDNIYDYDYDKMEIWKSIWEFGTSNLTPRCLCTCSFSMSDFNSSFENGNQNRNLEIKIGMSNSTPRSLCTCPFSSNLSLHSDDPTDADAGVYLCAPILYSFPPLLHHPHFNVERSHPDDDADPCEHVPFPQLFLFILILISSSYFFSFS